jgi:antitoxin component of MazEF toxin-antitoxin module
LLQKNLTRNGNSYALTLDKPLLELLHMSPETPVEIRTNGQSFLVTPVRPTDPARATAFLEALNQVNTTFDPLFQSLSKR